MEATAERQHAVEDPTPDRPITGNRPVTIGDLRAFQSGGQKVGLTTGALLTLGGTGLTMIAMAAALAWSVFQTEAQAMQQHGEIQLSVEKALGAHQVAPAPHPTFVTQTDLKEVVTNIHKLDKKISILGARQGLKHEMRQVDEEPTNP